MNKKYIILFVILILISIFIFMQNSTKELGNISSFKNIYNNEKDIDNIKIRIIDLQNNSEIPIENKEDIKILINAIKNSKLKPINKDEQLLGGAYSFKILNSKTDKTIKLSINNTQLSINNEKLYKTEIDLTNSIKETYIKYTLPIN